MKASFEGKTVQVQAWPIANIIPYELNAKKHETAQVARIAASLKKYGWTQPIVVDKYGVIINGHGRRAAVEFLGADAPFPGPGMAQVIQLSHLSPSEVKAARLADNRVAISDIDPNLMIASLADLDDKSLLDGIYDDKELEYFAADLGKVNDEAFVTDMAGVVADQKKDVDRRLEGVKGARVQLAKAFGFKDISAASQIVISSVMARAEASTGLAGDAAFVQWAESQLAMGF